MHNQKKPKNPWNKNVPQGKTNTTHCNNLPAPSELKFREAQSKLQAAVKKHIKNYESSSDEEDIESGNVVESVLKNYKNTSSQNQSLGRTQNFIEEALASGALTCLICISRVKRDDQIWSCMSCFAFFHLICIQRWSKDTLTQKKQAIEEHSAIKEVTLSWCCPKCRLSYNSEEVPKKYLCFCKKQENPKFDPFLIPHSCGEICKKDLVPNCGHKCLLLCHPGPCPPCPVIISVTCYCGAQSPIPRRCSDKNWSCNNKCGKALACLKHNCAELCHPGTCKPCPKKSLQKCVCGSQIKLRECAEPVWHCDKICNKPLPCGVHMCMQICHTNDCNNCPLTEPRTCPCGKSTFILPCTEETPTCKDTCNKLLECGMHACNQRCHKDKCGQCLETVIKSCRCSQHSKEIQCSKPYNCDTKCKRMKDCNKHPCNRKCCDGNCPPCEKPCGRSLNCGNHKCTSVCHRGPCYPCNLTEVVSCRCGGTTIQVPCGRKHKTKPPKCNKLCIIPPECHHEKRDPHKCHFGMCPPCKQICNRSQSLCSHTCSASCHSAVRIKVESQKASMPWEQTKPQVEVRALPCPDCTVPVAITCFGQHETSNWPCHIAKVSSCGRSCGRLLDCGNHTCSLLCHVVEGAQNKFKAGTNCEQCDKTCDKARPEGCNQLCPNPCHPGPCPPCKQMLRIKCHCGLNQPYVSCNEWLDLSKQEELQCCRNQCPKNFECGHRCKADCHPGECPNAKLCKKKVKVTCKCKRIKKEFPCQMVRNKSAIVECDELCLTKKEEERKHQEALQLKQKQEEEIKNQKELEKYQKIFEGKKKTREKRVSKSNEESGFIRKYKIMLFTVMFLTMSLGVFYILSYYD